MGLPRRGHTITASLTGTTGVPVVGIGVNVVPLPFCSCTIGHEWLVSVFGSSLPLPVPMRASISGLSIGVQGLDYLGTGGCPAPQLTLTDTVVLTFG
jgi:hypothetical protein